MPSITDLPCEIVGTILKNLDHLQWLPPALLACRHFYVSFKESHGVEASILRHQTTPALLPHAVAVMEASRLPRPLVSSSVFGLLEELYRSPARLAARVSALPTPVVRKMARTHDAIHALATGFATTAQERISPPRMVTALSPSEYFRFCRAFYRAELFYTLFGHRGFNDTMKEWFFWRHSHWENEQLACVYDYLDERFTQASFEVFAHDVVFGEMAVDYLAVGADNGWRQGWLSHGVEFVYRLTLADSYDARHSMLHATSSPRRARMSLPDALLEDEKTGDRKVGQYTDAELYSIAQRDGDEPADEDTDRGPYEAWRAANSDRWLEDSCMFSEAAWLRERAYVFWDADRLRGWQPGGFGDDPGDCPRECTEEEVDEMRESFRERSKIWQKGGRGYWSWDDTSRIVWPGGVPSSS